MLTSEWPPRQENKLDCHEVDVAFVEIHASITSAPSIAIFCLSQFPESPLSTIT